MNCADLDDANLFGNKHQPGVMNIDAAITCSFD